MPVTCSYIEDDDGVIIGGCEGNGVNEWFDHEGEVHTEVCKECNGTGVLWTKQELKLKKELLWYIRKHWDVDFESILSVMVKLKQKEEAYWKIVCDND